MSLPGAKFQPPSLPAVLTNYHTVGITVPKLLPITGTFAPGQSPSTQPTLSALLPPRLPNHSCALTSSSLTAFAIYHCILAIRVSQVRINSNTLIGDRTKATSSSASAGPEADALLVATRCHSNFAENVPFAVLLGAVVEMVSPSFPVQSWHVVAAIKADTDLGRMCRMVEIELPSRQPSRRSWRRGSCMWSWG